MKKHNLKILITFKERMNFKMKNKLLILMVAVLLFLPYSVKANEKVPVYIFRGEGCPHCEEALEYFDALSDEDKAKFDLIEYEVWYDENNSNIMSKVAAKLGETASGVPYIIVGEKSFSGFDDSTGESIMAAINEMYESNEIIDIVDPIVNNVENTKNNDTAIVVITCAVVLAAVLLIIKARKEL
jgi:glutaredoxin